MSLRHTDSTYSLASINAALSLLLSEALGQPPRHTRKAILRMSRLLVPSTFPPFENKLPRLTSPVESPDSHSDIVRIFIQPKRPVPVWNISDVEAGTAEPVSINCPSSPRWSTSKRMASHNLGAICHSSMSRGVSPFSKRLMFVDAMVRLRSFISGSAI